MTYVVRGCDPVQQDEVYRCNIHHKTKEGMEDTWRAMGVIHGMSLISSITVLLIMSTYTMKFSRHTQEKRMDAIIMMNECDGHAVNRRANTSGLLGESVTHVESESLG